MPVLRVIAGALVLLLLTPSISQSQQPAELSLSKAVASAEAHHPSIAAALLAAEAAGSRASQAGKWANPEFNVYQENFPGAARANQWIVSLSQRIRLGGQLGRSSDLESTHQRALSKDAEAVRRAIGFHVEREYAAGYAYQRQLEIVTETIASANSLMRDMEARLVEEDVSAYEVMRLEREVDALNVRAVSLRSEHGKVLIRLAALTGIAAPADGWIFATPEGQADGPPPVTAAAPGSQDSRQDTRGVREAALGRRPDVEAAVERQHAAGQAEELARKQSIPDLVLTAGYSRLDPGIDGFVWSVGLTLPVFDRRTDAAAALQLEQARWDRRVASMKVEAGAQREQARRGYVDATAALQRIGSRKESGLAPVARLAYEEGEMSVMEFVDALRTDLEARSMRLELERQRSVHWFEWRWAIGEEPRGDLQ